MEYTLTEKLIADTIREALRDLDRAEQDMRKQGWHRSADKNLKLAYVGVHSALAAQRLTFEAVNSIMDAPQCPEVIRLPAWDGFPKDENGQAKEGVRS